ncbi:hypothetical protein Patl1_08379 [Pistacia atlantica]|uniref:Uncharacterized protein n=1 Tax=Pistacia atlantica TaxID=434234 RepID=A0ACC1AK69_9ROSI|nr:hypothetical protein Patl1_08379 [Pistacia atlantica]
MNYMIREVGSGSSLKSNKPKKSSSKLNSIIHELIRDLTRACGLKFELAHLDPSHHELELARIRRRKSWEKQNEEEEEEQFFILHTNHIQYKNEELDKQNEEALSGFEARGVFNYNFIFHS